MTLVRSEHPGQDIEQLTARLTTLESELSTRHAELTHARADLAAFRIRYTQEVGLLHDELEELQRAVAEAELGAMAKRLEDERGAAGTAPAGPQPESEPRLTSDAVRKLFRDVAKMIHPDLAFDDRTRDRRHTLMIEANRAYALGDEERLRWILEAWEKSPEAITGSDPDAIRERLARRIAQLEGQLAACSGEFAELKASPLYELKVMVDEAAARGKDLVADMVRRLKRDILATRNRLEAMRWNP